MKCLPLTLSHGETGHINPSASNHTLPAFPGKPGVLPRGLLSCLWLPLLGLETGRRTGPLKVTVHGSPTMGTQQLLRDHFELQGLSKEDSGQEDWFCRAASLSSLGLERSDQQGGRSGQLWRASGLEQACACSG